MFNSVIFIFEIKYIYFLHSYILITKWKNFNISIVSSSLNIFWSSLPNLPEMIERTNILSKVYSTLGI